MPSVVSYKVTTESRQLPVNKDQPLKIQFFYETLHHGFVHHPKSPWYHDTLLWRGGGEKDFVVSPWDHLISHGDNEIAHGLMVMLGKKSPPPTKSESHGLMVRPWDILWWSWENSWSHRELARGHHVVSHGEIVAAGSSRKIWNPTTTPSGILTTGARESKKWNNFR